MIDCDIQTSTGVSNAGKQGECTGKITQTSNGKYRQTKTGYPKNVLKIASEGNTSHPTQKPVELFEYLIKTYTDEGDIVLDNCLGSGTTLVACQNTNRNGIGFEKEPKYEDIIRKRIMADIPRLDKWG